MRVWVDARDGAAWLTNARRAADVITREHNAACPSADQRPGVCWLLPAASCSASRDASAAGTRLLRSFRHTCVVGYGASPPVVHPQRAWQ